MRIQKDAEAIVHSLLHVGHPFDVPPDPPFFRLADAIMLQIMRRHGSQVDRIFAAMFERNPVDRVFRFLDEEASPAETLALISTLPPWLFLEAFVRAKVLGRR
jgi:lycopene beta-cyclase